MINVDTEVKVGYVSHKARFGGQGKGSGSGFGVRVRVRGQGKGKGSE